MMRLQIARSWDFNQMLVASVFGHLLLMTFVLFLPKSTTFEKILPPAFMVELVEISRGEKKPAQKPSQKKLISKPAGKTKPASAKTLSPIKPITPPKSFEPIRQSIKMPPEPKTPKVSHNTSDQILNSLNQLNNSPEKLSQEMDQLAKLVPKVSVQQPAIKKIKPIQETTFDETNTLKNKKVEPMPSKVVPLSIEDTLDVETPPKDLSADNQVDSSLKKLEFASISRPNLQLKKKQDEKTSADLLKELEEMKQPTLAKKELEVDQSQEVKVPSVTQEKSQAYDSILKKLDSLNDNKPKDIDTKIVAPETLAQNFQSDIRKVSVPKRVQVDLEISPNQAYVHSSIPGKPGADALALYKGMIIKKVMENWHAPLGQDHNKKVLISFNIYPQGNIDRPDLKESSRVELLDNLALRAIRESEPFPKFPESLKSSNLNINIHFKYIPEKNKT